MCKNYRCRGVMGFLDLRSIEQNIVSRLGFREAFPLRYEILRFPPAFLSSYLANISILKKFELIF